MMGTDISVSDGWDAIRPILAAFADPGPGNATLQGFLNRWNAGEHLDFEDAYAAFDALLDVSSSDFQIGEFLIRGQTENLNIEEVAGFARALRDRAPIVESPMIRGAVIGDTCGTGGDTIPTFNVSTTVMFVLAASGMPIAKHGNRAFTSRCGSADVLQKLGVCIQLPRAAVIECLSKIRIAFMFAPVFHGATAKVQRVRKILAEEMPPNLKQKTVFNVLGPLSNPAHAGVQMIGVYTPAILDRIAYVLQRLDIRRAAVVHGHCDAPGFENRGLDEVSTLGTTQVAEVREADVFRYTLQPGNFGLHKADPREIEGGDMDRNAEILHGILAGQIEGPKLDLVLANAAVGLYLYDKRQDRLLPECAKQYVEQARELIRSGDALRKLEELRDVSRELGERFRVE